MGRRLVIGLSTALAVIGFWRATGVVAAGPDETPPPSSSPPGAASAPVDLPAEFTAPGGSASNPVPDPAEAPLPPAAPVAPPPGADAPAAPPPPVPVPRDPKVVPAQSAAGKRPTPARAQIPAPTPTPLSAPGEGSALPPASEGPGQPEAPAAPGGATREAEPLFTLPAESLPLGRQSVGLTVDVVAPQVLNLNQVASLKVVVRNSGTADARGVVVRDQLPPTLSFLSSQPEAQRIDALLTWHLGTIPAGSERVITLSVKPVKIGAFDHAATVTMLVGGKSRTMVREPKLKVEQTATSGTILKGQPVQFKISVSNPGDGPARNVTVQAKLSPGLRHASGDPNDQNLFEQTIDTIGPGERVTLETLVADTTQGGEQSCLVIAHSPDVVAPAGSGDARSLQTVNVVEPRLTLKVTGPDKRYTDTLAPYDLTLENPGTAAARNVRVQVTVPLSGKLYQLPQGARFDPQTRRLTWSRPQLDPGEKAVLSFQVRMGGVGLYPVAAEARAEGVPLAKDLFQTDVEGLADVNFEVSEKRRVVDVDGVTTYTIKVVNSGTKEASQLLISAELSRNIVPQRTSGTDTQASWNKKDNKIVFPTIEKLGPGKSIELEILVKAVEPGIATCRVYLVHEDLKEKLDDVAAFKITPTRR
jgi:uncharacterized repeat protein (TIGR01451 family)